MHRCVYLAAALTLGVMVVACGDDDGTSDTTSTTATTEITTTADLEAMLLTADEIEAALDDTEGWAVQPIGGEGLAGYLELPCDDVALDPAIVERLTADAGVDAGRDDANASMIELLITGDAGQLSADLEAFSDADQSCATLSTSPDAAVQELALPELGDERRGEVGTCEGWAPDSRSYMALVRVGTVAVLLGMCEQPVTTDAELQITDEEFVQLLETAVAKVNGQE